MCSHLLTNATQKLQYEGIVRFFRLLRYIWDNQIELIRWIWECEHLGLSEANSTKHNTTCILGTSFRIACTQLNYNCTLLRKIKKSICSQFARSIRNCPWSTVHMCVCVTYNSTGYWYTDISLNTDVWIVWLVMLLLFSLQWILIFDCIIISIVPHPLDPGGGGNIISSGKF